MEAYGERLQTAFFPNRSLSSLWESCPNAMLWEAICSEDCTIISNEEIISYLHCVSTVLLFDEPLPAMYLGMEPKVERISSEAVIRAMMQPIDVPMQEGKSILGQESVYLVDCNFTWMVIFTTENTVNGERLCAFVRNSNTYYE